jgi:hypothetical protein
MADTGPPLGIRPTVLVRRESSGPVSGSNSKHDRQDRQYINPRRLDFIDGANRLRSPAKRGRYAGGGFRPTATSHSSSRRRQPSSAAMIRAIAATTAVVGREKGRLKRISSTTRALRDFSSFRQDWLKILVGMKRNRGEIDCDTELPICYFLQMRRGPE